MIDTTILLLLSFACFIFVSISAVKWYSTDLQDLVSLNNSVKLFHQIKNLSEEFSLYFDVSIRLIRLRLAHSRPALARPGSSLGPDSSRLR